LQVVPNFQRAQHFQRSRFAQHFLELEEEELLQLDEFFFWFEKKEDHRISFLIIRYAYL
jgi:hypothetical protein